MDEDTEIPPKMSMSVSFVGEIMIRKKAAP